MTQPVNPSNPCPNIDHESAQPAKKSRYTAFKNDVWETYSKLYTDCEKSYCNEKFPKDDPSISQAVRKKCVEDCKDFKFKMLIWSMK